MWDNLPLMENAFLNWLTSESFEHKCVKRAREPFFQYTLPCCWPLTPIDLIYALSNVEITELSS